MRRLLNIIMDGGVLEYGFVFFTAIAIFGSIIGIIDNWDTTKVTVLGALVLGAVVHHLDLAPGAFIEEWRGAEALAAEDGDAAPVVRRFVLLFPPWLDPNFFRVLLGRDMLRLWLIMFLVFFVIFHFQIQIQSALQAGNTNTNSSGGGDDLDFEAQFYRNLELLQNSFGLDFGSLSLPRLMLRIFTITFGVVYCVLLVPTLLQTLAQRLAR